jgi:hypothetical protein
MQKVKNRRNSELPSANTDEAAQRETSRAELRQRRRGKVAEDGAMPHTPGACGATSRSQIRLATKEFGEGRWSGGATGSC